MFSGIFRLFFLDDPMTSTYLSMALGTLFIIFLHRRTPQKNFLSMYPACVAASFWSYSTGSEFFILILPALCCFHTMLETDVGKFRWFLRGMFFYSALMFLQCFDLGCDLFAINQMLGLSYLAGKFAGVVLRVSFCFVFIEIALCINRRLKRSLDRAAD